MAEINPDQRILSHSIWDCKYPVPCTTLPPKCPQTRLARGLGISQLAVSTTVTRGEQGGEEEYRINEYPSPLFVCFRPATAPREIRRFDHSGFRIVSDTVGSGRPGNRLPERDSHGPWQISRGRYHGPLLGYGFSLRAGSSESQTRLNDGTLDNCRWPALTPASLCKSLSHPLVHCTPKPHD